MEEAHMRKYAELYLEIAYQWCPFKLMVYGVQNWAYKVPVVSLEERGVKVHQNVAKTLVIYMLHAHVHYLYDYCQNTLYAYTRNSWNSSTIATSIQLWVVYGIIEGFPTKWLLRWQSGLSVKLNENADLGYTQSCRIGVSLSFSVGVSFRAILLCLI